jgi:hypothetical protein
MYARTSLIVSSAENAKLLGIQPSFYRLRNCDTNLNSHTPANQYQIQKLIQNTVRVYSSLYTMNLAALNAYEVPDTNYQVVDIAGTNYLTSPGVNWNQMSDRRQPHKQFATASGSTYGASSTRRTVTRLQPGALSPGGHGVDIKHNSYDRYLNRLKGKGPVRRGPIPPTFGAPIPFNRALPIYGGKTVKTSIVSNCNCPIVATPISEQSEKLIYEVPPSEYEINNVVFKFNVGQTVYALQECNTYEKATIIAIDSECGTFTVQYEDGCTQVVTENQLKIYFDCTGCNDVVPPDSFSSSSLVVGVVCYDPNYLALKGSVRPGDFV